MESRSLRRAAIAGLTIVCSAVPLRSQAVASAPTDTLDRRTLESVMGRPGAVLAGGVLRFGMPRADLDVRIGEVRIRPNFALGSWLAFKVAPGGAVAMGDLVLLESELGPVLARLQSGGIEQSAIHHHLVGESPHVLYVHLHAHGEARPIAEAVRAALALTGTPAPATTGSPAGAPANTPVTATAAPVPFALDSAAIGSTIGFHGTVNGGVLQIGVPRSETIREMGVEIPPTMGLATAINFQPTGDGKAAITGDFVLLGSEVNPVIRVLQSQGIAVTSLHNHLLDDEPRLFFMHFWANDDALKLARGLRAALDVTNSHRPVR
ncbi:MAG: DUF1259 domain-containing protein [Gemmatimonadetes bacterium]|nr:DUF1259 domain-containing protein [Gemmatimonadota bacterium]